MPCQVTQSLSGDTQPEPVREPANLLSGKPSEGKSLGDAVLESRALLGLGPAAADAFGYTRGFQELRETQLSMGTSYNIDIFELQFKIPPPPPPPTFAVTLGIPSMWLRAANSSAQQPGVICVCVCGGWGGGGGEQFL